MSRIRDIRAYLSIENPPIPPFTKGGSRGDYGFTLLELIISISIIGIIVLIIVSAMRLGYRSVNAGEKKAEYLERIRTSLNIIDSQIQSEIPLIFDEDGVKKIYFKGERDSIQFSTNYSIWGGQKGYVIVAYRIESDDHGKQNLYASENVIGISENREVRLLVPLDKIFFEYFYKDPTEEQGKWVERWTDETRIPEKIRVNLIDGTRDFSIIIPMRSRKFLTQLSSGQGGKFVGPFGGQ
ncbi:MAG: prepilin-type N-terminal cleavage/methylation domain-containing protein [Nitrospirota bacterium]